MDDIAADVHGEITTDSSWGRLAGLGGTEQLASLDGSVGSLPDHGENWSGLHEVNETIEEWLALEISVVSLEVSLRWLDELHSEELESLLLKTLDDGSDEAALDSVGLNHDECLIFVADHLKVQI